MRAELEGDEKQLVDYKKTRVDLWLTDTGLKNESALRVSTSRMDADARQEIERKREAEATESLRAEIQQLDEIERLIQQIEEIRRNAQ